MIYSLFQYEKIIYNIIKTYLTDFSEVINNTIKQKMWPKISSIGRFAHSAKIFQYYVIHLLINAAKWCNYC